jgi:sugar/nucleoside kinase (ribokinase family)
VASGAFDLVTMGRVGVDLYPRQAGVGLEDVESFGKFLGGSATNVAVAAARYGRRSAVITKTGADPFGTFVRKALRGYGVDDRFVGTSHHLPTPVTFCEIFPPDDFPLYFYRYPKAPDLDIAVGNLDECETAVATREPREAAKALRDRGISLAVVKQGPKGVLAVDDTGEVEVPPVPVEVVNGLGAGDAFGGALAHGMLSTWDTERIMRFANAAGAHVAGELACSDAMPTEAQVLAKLGEVKGV